MGLRKSEYLYNCKALLITKTKMWGSCYKRLFLVNMLAKFILKHKEDTYIYIYPPGNWRTLMDPFSRQAKNSPPIITVPVNSHYNFPTVNKLEPLLLRQRAVLVYLQHLVCLPISCWSYRWFPRAVSPPLMHELSRTSLTVLLLLKIMGLAKVVPIKPK